MRIVIYSVSLVCALWLLSTWLSEPSFHERFWLNEREVGAAAEPRRSLPDPASFTEIDDFYHWQTATRVAYQTALETPRSERTASSSVNMLHREETRQGTVIEYFEIQAEDGLRVPGVLQYPKSQTDLPAIIVIPGHTKPGESGLSQLVREHDSYQHAAATEIAAAGFVTAAIELRGFGLLGVPNYPEHKIAAYNELLKGGSYKGRVLGDLKILYDFLATKPFVDATRIGATGASLGGELAVALGASLPAIQAIAFSSYIERGPFSGLKASRTKQPHYCHLIPGIAQLMDKDDVFRLLAPRPTLGVREVSKGGVFRQFADNMKSLWTLLGASQQFEFVEIEQGKHEFYVPQTIAFFKRHLSKQN